MTKLTMVLAAIAVASRAGAAMAQCTVSSDPNATVRPLSPQTQADANVVLSMSLLPKMMHLDYADAARKKPACDLGAFSAGGETYELYGEDKTGRERIARPATKGGAIAEILPVADVMEAIKASGQGKSAPVTGYMLATITKNDFTGWRYYTGMPDPETLKRDIAAALGNGMAPIFRNGSGGKTDIFVPHG